MQQLWMYAIRLLVGNAIILDKSIFLVVFVFRMSLLSAVVLGIGRRLISEPGFSTATSQLTSCGNIFKGCPVPH
jgi:hypothetical protein